MQSRDKKVPNERKNSMIKSDFALLLCYKRTVNKIMSFFQLSIERSVMLLDKVASLIYQKLFFFIEYFYKYLPSIGGLTYE